MKEKILKCGVISWIILITIWGVGSLGYDEYFLPSPVETITGVRELILNGTLWIDIAASISRVLRGWLLAVVLGVPLGLLVGNFKAVRFIIEPILSFFRFVPAIALTTLFLMWFGVGDESKIALIFYASFFPVFVNTIAGVVSTDHSYIEAASCMGADRIRVFFNYTIFPAAIQYGKIALTTPRSPPASGNTAPGGPPAFPAPAPAPRCTPPAGGGNAPPGGRSRRRTRGRS